MKERGTLGKALETAGKAWTIVSIPFEIYLLVNGLQIGNSLKVVLGGGGLIFDIFAWRWLSKNKKEISNLKSIEPRGSKRIDNILKFRQDKNVLASAA